jgi:hypothetical protein
MLKKRASAQGYTMVRVWQCLIYVIGGRADGHCERYDVNLNEWKQISSHPTPMALSNFNGFNALEKYIYMVGSIQKN